MFKRIMIPTDGSALSEKAIALGVELAASLKASVCGFYAAPTFHMVSSVIDVVEATPDSYVKEAIQRAARYLEAVSAACRQAGVACECEYEFNDHPYQAIVRVAAEQGCDLVVMASHGRHGVSRLLLGSETAKVLLESSTPVLVYH
ncbi:universal stress protein [Dyella koreensis]|uniref:Universal stress protein n=1 Tax=Dyella koreensis TaxID=311235 RepID=A0ABW8KA09_9GAMM